MYTLEIKDGDLSLDGGLISTLSGHKMIAQELTSWLIEPIGSNPLNIPFGSELYKYIGVNISSDVVSEIESEIYRILNNYIAYYNKKYETNLYNSTSAFKPEDIIKSVDDISIIQDGTAVIVRIILNTYAGQLEIVRAI